MWNSTPSSGLGGAPLCGSCHFLAPVIAYASPSSIIILSFTFYVRWLGLEPCRQRIRGYDDLKVHEKG